MLFDFKDLDLGRVVGSEEIKWKMKKCKIQSKLVQNRIVKIILNLNRKKLSSIGKLNTAFFKYQ